MRFYWLFLGILAVWRVAHLLAAEDGPWDAIVRLRRLAGAGFWGNLLDCFYCLSLWLAAPLALLIGEGWGERLLLWPALSGGAILLERLIPGTPKALWTEDPEERHDALLRPKETASRCRAN